MLAVIHRTSDDVGESALSVAGKPLAVRQLQYLRAIGARRIAIEHGSSLREDEISAWLVDQALASFVDIVASREPLGALEVARRAGFDPEESIVAIRSSALLDVDLKPALEAVSSGAPIRCLARSPRAVDAIAGTSVLVAARRADLDAEHVAELECSGWGATVRSRAEALALGTAALDGALPERADGATWPIQIHASPRTPGVWVGRGARVADDAELIRPVYIGPDAVIQSGARVGPNAVIERGAVIGRGAHVANASILQGTIVGEGLWFDDIAAGPVGLYDLETGECHEVDDEAMLAARVQPFYVGVATRALALVALLVLFPVAALLLAGELVRGRSLGTGVRRRMGDGAVHVFEPSTRSRLLATWLRLTDVVRGRRALVGVTRDARSLGVSEVPALVADASRAVPGALAIDDALTLFDDADSRLRGMAWYALAKSRRSDLELVWRALRAPSRTETLETLGAGG